MNRLGVMGPLFDFSRFGRKRIVVLALALACAGAAIDITLSSEADLVHTEVLKSVVRRPLEDRFQRAEIGNGSRLTGVVSLGGGDERVREAGRLGRLLPHIRIVLCDSRDSLALLGDGIDAARITLEERSRTTWENALFTEALVKPAAGERWLLVTSAVHMPRAMGAFRKAGFEVEPWPVRDTPDRYLMYPAVRHEWLGLIAYALLGRSTSVFPGPLTPK